MTTPQPGLLLDPTAAPLFLVLEAGESESDAKETARVAASLPEWAAEIDMLGGGRGTLKTTVAFGAEFWKRIASDAPKRLAPFVELEGPGGRAVATGGDVFVHVHSDRRDLAVEVLLRLQAELEGAARIVEEVHAFRYLDSRDLTGFVDGTENPEPDERTAAALVADEDAEFAGGSYVLVQRYAHNLRYWGRLTREEQEGAIGRTKPDSEELPDDVRPESAHISRVVIEEDGHELEIVRHSTPWAADGRQGLVFVAYGRTPATYDKMLARMYGTSGDGIHDRLMDFTEALTGAYFFAPSVERLAELGK